MSKEYIGSQQHWEDSVNDDYNRREQMQQEQEKEHDQHYRTDMLNDETEQPQPDETLEQAAENYAFNLSLQSFYEPKRDAFLAGAAYMKEKMWSDEDMQECATAFFYHWYNAKGTNTKKGCEDWIKYWLTQYRKQK